MIYDMPDCPPPPPPPPLFAIVGYHQNVNTGSPWPLDGSSYWHLAIVLFALILLVTVWSYVRHARSAPLGWRRHLSALLVSVGALGMLVLIGYLLLVGWPGTQLDTRWWFSEFSSYGGSCPNALNQVDHEHTLMRDALNNRATWGLLGAVALFIVGLVTSAAHGTARSSN